MFKIAVLTSGKSRGSNLRAMLEYFRLNKLPVQVCFAVITQKEAPITEVCKEYDVNCQLIPYTSSERFEEVILHLCQDNGIQLIALAGFLKKLSPMFIRDAGVPILNIHPALLPKYGGKGMFGMAVHKAVFEAGDDVSGATVHLVDPQYDNGKIIAQEKVGIFKAMSPEEVAAIVLKTEHAIYGKTIWDFLIHIYT